MMGTAISAFNDSLFRLGPRDKADLKPKVKEQPDDDDLALSEEGSFMTRTTPATPFTPFTPYHPSGPSGPFASGNQSAPAASFEIRKIPGKGRGMVALRDLNPGELILSETPILKLASDEMSFYRLEWMINNLSEHERATFYSLHHTGMDELPQIFEIWRKNCFGVGTNDQAILDVCSMINNSCLPNVSVSWDEDEGTMNVFAVTPIAEGEELTFCYAGTLNPRNTRHEVLQTVWEFDCRCEACSWKGGKLARSDQNRQQVAWILSCLNNDTFAPETQLEKIKEALDLLQEETLFCQMIQFSWHAYQLTAQMGRMDEAKVWAEAAYEHSRLTNGPDHRVTLLAWNGITRPKYHKAPRSWNLFGGCNIS